MTSSEARSLLDGERRQLETAMSTVRAEVAENQVGAADELMSSDQHPAEVGTGVNDMSRDLGLREDFGILLRENDAGRRRLGDGTYGRCERCGKPIGDERLRARPAARYCVDDQVVMAR